MHRASRTGGRRREHPRGHEARTGGGSLGGLASGERSELPLKANDHALDATRYALHTALRQTRAVEDYLRTWLGWRRP